MSKLNFKNFTQDQKKLRERILEVSFKRKLAHIGSCLSAIDLIYCTYKYKRKNDLFVLSNGHAGIALYSVLEKFGYIKTLNKIHSLNIHPDREKKFNIAVSTGSLGQGLPIALGMALANPKINIYCMISDGEASEGSIWESLRIAYDNKVQNIKIIINANGWGAYHKISTSLLKKRIEGFGWNALEVDAHNIKKLEKTFHTFSRKYPTVLFGKTTSDQFTFLKGQDAHYYVMTEEDYKGALEKLL